MDNKNKQSENIIKIADPQFEGKEILQHGIRQILGQLRDIKKTFNYILTSVIVVLALGFITLLFMVATMMIDSWNFNSTIYKENKVLEVNSKIIQNNSNEQQDINKRLDKIEFLLKIR
ncbi:MAG: hypothetical protein AAB636_01630 [Patescibacteria group bacterium]